VVWNRPAGEKSADAASFPLTEPETAPYMVSAPEAAAPQPAVVQPGAPQPGVVQPAAVAPSSRRSRRAQTAAQPVTVPSIAPVAPAEPERIAATFEADLPTSEAPAPLRETVLAPAEPFELLEPVADAATSANAEAEPIEPQPTAAPAASAVDEFEAASRLFSFTGETPVTKPAAEAPTATAPDATAHAAPRRPQARRGSAFKRAATASFTVGVIGIVGLLAVGMTTPAEAVAAVNGTDASLSVLAVGDDSVPVIDEAEIQAYIAPGDAQSDTLQRTENYATTTTAQLASEAGISNFSNLFHNNPNSNIQWPFTVGVTMSYGFGMRSGRMHEGIDFTPGNGAPVQAIADGTVRVASEAGGAYGVHVIIDHIVDGQMVSSHYAHMQYGSLQVTPGQHVTVGTVIGRTGNTGRSYGAHTHFEILDNGTTAIDPWPWLEKYTDGTHTVG